MMWLLLAGGVLCFLGAVGDLRPDLPFGARLSAAVSIAGGVGLLVAAGHG